MCSCVPEDDIVVSSLQTNPCPLAGVGKGEDGDQDNALREFYIGGFVTLQLDKLGQTT